MLSGDAFESCLVAQRYQYENYTVQLLNVQSMKEKTLIYGKRTSYFPGAFWLKCCRNAGLVPQGRTIRGLWSEATGSDQCPALLVYTWSRGKYCSTYYANGITGFRQEPTGALVWAKVKYRKSVRCLARKFAKRWWQCTSFFWTKFSQTFLFCDILKMTMTSLKDHIRTCTCSSIWIEFSNIILEMGWQSWCWLVLNIHQSQFY